MTIESSGVTPSPLLDDAGFTAAREAAETLLAEERRGIGRLGEKLVHATLKYYYQPDAALHEQPLGRYVADALTGDGGVIEIQSQGLSGMKAKLSAFLERGRVTVVHPLSAVKYLSWMDPETGECSKPRKSPRQGTPSDALRELYGLRDFLGREGLQIQLALLDVVEYRKLNGWSADRKRGSERYDRFPLCLRRLVTLESFDDYRRLLPEGLPEPFTAKDFGRQSRMTARTAGWALSTLRLTNTVRQTGKQGRAYLYSAGKE